MQSKFWSFKVKICTVRSKVWFLGQYFGFSRSRFWFLYQNLLKLWFLVKILVFQGQNWSNFFFFSSNFVYLMVLSKNNWRINVITVEYCISILIKLYFYLPNALLGCEDLLNLLRWADWKHFHFRWALGTDKILHLDFVCRRSASEIGRD